MLRPYTRQKKKKRKEIKSTSSPIDKQKFRNSTAPLETRKGKQVACTGRVITRRITSDHKLYLVARTNNDSCLCAQSFIRFLSIQSTHQLALLSFRYTSTLSLSFSFSYSSLFFPHHAILIYLSLPRVVDKSPLHSSIQSVERISRFFFFSLSLFPQSYLSILVPFCSKRALQGLFYRFELSIIQRC